MSQVHTSLATNKSTKTRNSVWRVGLYIRLSKEDGSDESLSVTNQRKILLDFVTHAFEGDYVLADCYVDDGVSGTDYERPDFQRMLRDIESGCVNCIICKNLSRAFRNYADQGYFLEHFFPLHNTRFITLGDPKIDSFLHPEVIQGLEVPINGLLNDRYAAKTSHDVRRTFDMKRKNGEFIGAFAPFGYQKSSLDKNRFCIDEEAAAVVRDIFKWYVHEGMSKAGIAKRLNELGQPNPTAYKKNKGSQFHSPMSERNDGMWSPKTIRDILLNQMYIGTMVQGKQRVISYKVHERISVPQDEWYLVQHTHEPIIEQGLFDAAQSLHSRDTRAAPLGRAVYLFSGFVRCADCGKAMTRRTAKGHVYYACRTYQEKDKTKCKKHTIREDALEQAILVAIQRQMASSDRLAEVIQAIQTVPVADTQYQRVMQLFERRQQELQKLRTVTDALYVDWKMGELSANEYRRMKAKFQTQIEQVEHNMAHLQKEREQWANGAKAVQPYVDYFIEHKTVDHLVRGILAELVETILINAQGDIEVRFTFADPYKTSVKPMAQGRCT